MYLQGSDVSVSSDGWCHYPRANVGPMPRLAGSDHWPRLQTLVNSFRVAVLGTIAFLAFLMVLVALVAATADVSDRGMAVVTTVLAVLPTLVTSLLVYLKVEGIEAKTDQAAVKAAEAAKKAEEIHHDVLNGPMRANVRAAIAEAADDPKIQAKRIETIAKGVQQDRHTTGSREAAAYARGVTDAMKRWGDGAASESEEPQS